MSRPADFPPVVREALAKRADNRCSFPECQNSTIAPSAEGPNAVSNSGEAAHIVAAESGPGARRANKDGLTLEQLKSIDNGVWMCATHARQIDRDEITYTIPMLQLWRQIRELKSTLRHQLGKEIEFGPDRFNHLPLAHDHIKLDGLGPENDIIGNAFLNSCVYEIWGKGVGLAIRDLTIELVRNAFQHGHATEFNLSIGSKEITLHDDGNPFLHEDLLKYPGQRGGAAAMRYLRQNHSEHLVIAPVHEGLGNELTIALINRPDDIKEVTKCVHSISRGDLKRGSSPIQLISGCDKSYLILPPFLTYSDIFIFKTILKRSLFNEDNCVLVLQGNSSGVLEFVQDQIPRFRVMHFG